MGIEFAAVQRKWGAMLARSEAVFAVVGLDVVVVSRLKRTPSGQYCEVNQDLLVAWGCAGKGSTQRSSLAGLSRRRLFGPVSMVEASSSNRHVIKDSEVPRTATNCDVTNGQTEFCNRQGHCKGIGGEERLVFVWFVGSFEIFPVGWVDRCSSPTLVGVVLNVDGWAKVASRASSVDSVPAFRPGLFAEGRNRSISEFVRVISFDQRFERVLLGDHRRCWQYCRVHVGPARRGAGGPFGKRESSVVLVVCRGNRPRFSHPGRFTTRSLHYERKSTPQPPRPEPHGPLRRYGAFARRVGQNRPRGRSGRSLVGMLEAFRPSLVGMCLALGLAGGAGYSREYGYFLPGVVQLAQVVAKRIQGISPGGTGQSPQAKLGYWSPVIHSSEGGLGDGIPEGVVGSGVAAYTPYHSPAAHGSLGYRTTWCVDHLFVVLKPFGGDGYILVQDARPFEGVIRAVGRVDRKEIWAFPGPCASKVLGRAVGHRNVSAGVAFGLGDGGTDNQLGALVNDQLASVGLVKSVIRLHPAAFESGGEASRARFFGCGPLGGPIAGLFLPAARLSEGQGGRAGIPSDELGGRLVASVVLSESLVPGLADRPGRDHQLVDLGLEVADRRTKSDSAYRLVARGRSPLRAVEDEPTEHDESRFGAPIEGLDEQDIQGIEMMPAEPGGRAGAERLAGREEPERHVVRAASLHVARGGHPARIAPQQELQQLRGAVGQGTAEIGVSGIEIEKLFDGFADGANLVILGEAAVERRCQQKQPSWVRVAEDTISPDGGATGAENRREVLFPTNEELFRRTRSQHGPIPLARQQVREYSDVPNAPVGGMFHNWVGDRDAGRVLIYVPSTSRDGHRPSQPVKPVRRFPQWTRRCPLAFWIPLLDRCWPSITGSLPGNIEPKRPPTTILPRLPGATSTPPVVAPVTPDLNETLEILLGRDYGRANCRSVYCYQDGGYISERMKLWSDRSLLMEQV